MCLNKTPKSTGLLAIICLAGLLMIPVSGIAQSIDAVQDKVNSRITAIKDSIASKRIYLSGRATTQIQATYGHDAKPVYDYMVNLNVEASYKGIRLPFQYVFSNGRSIYRFQGPSYRTPGFNKIGISPNFKGYKLHLGNRIMDFSRYTYQQVRFEGFGLETPEKGLHIKYFSGKLKLVDPANLVYNTSIDPVYNRQAWGTLIGYSREKTAIKVIVFKAEDQADSLLHDSARVLPKENTVISGSFQVKLHEKITLQAEQAISAYTDNSFSPRIDILTPQTVHNMFGLFERKASSNYYGACNMEIAYAIGDQKAGYVMETVDKNYRSLGSLFYDNNFIEHRLFASGIWKEKLTYSGSFGTRRNRITQDTLPSQSKFVFQSTLSYQWNERLTTFGTFNNLKTVQQEYYRSFQSNTVDSLSLAQVNTALALGSTYLINTASPIQLNALFSTQRSNGIENEVITQADNQSHMASIGYNQQFEKRNLQGTLSYVSTKAVTYQNETWQVSALYGHILSEKTRLNVSVQYQSVQFGEDQVNQVIQRNMLDIALTKKMLLRIEAGMDLSDSKSKFALDRLNIRMDGNYKF